MNKTITNKDEYMYMCNVRNYPMTYDNKMEKEFFGHKVILEKNKWQWHLHIKVTNACNAKCAFCVEQNSVCKSNAKHLIENVDKMLDELKKNKTLFSVSVTGGEPLVFPEFRQLCDVLRKHKIPFLTMNTNGQFLKDYVDCIDGLFCFVNISRHSIDDEENYKIFGTRNVPSLDELKEIKKLYKKTKIRFQCVMENTINIDDFMDFITKFSFADDLSFRRLMLLGEEYGVKYDSHTDDYFKILQYIFDNFTLREQTIQDYYIYETWDCVTKDNKHIDVTFSYSDMEILREVEKHESSSVIREFICHPNGHICGSWNPDEKVLLE